MELDLVGVGAAHLRDLLALGDALSFLHQELVVVAVDGQERVVVLDDDQLAEAADAGTAENDLPGGARVDRLARLARYADPLQVRGIAEVVDDLAARRPGELYLVAIGRRRRDRLAFRSRLRARFRLDAGGTPRL